MAANFKVKVKVKRKIATVLPSERCWIRAPFQTLDIKEVLASSYDYEKFQKNSKFWFFI